MLLHTHIELPCGQPCTSNVPHVGCSNQLSPWQSLVLGFPAKQCSLLASQAGLCGQCLEVLYAV